MMEAPLDAVKGCSKGCSMSTDSPNLQSECICVRKLQICKRSKYYNQNQTPPTFVIIACLHWLTSTPSKQEEGPFNSDTHSGNKLRACGQLMHDHTLFFGWSTVACSFSFISSCRKGCAHLLSCAFTCTLLSGLPPVGLGHY